MVIADYDNIICSVVVKEVRHESLECHDADVGCFVGSRLGFCEDLGKFRFQKQSECLFGGKLKMST